MLIDLNSEDLSHLILGTAPADDIVHAHLLKTSLGAYSGSYNRWVWNRSTVAKLDDESKLALYCLLVGAAPVEGTIPPGTDAHIAIEDPASPPSHDELT